MNTVIRCSKCGKTAKDLSEKGWSVLRWTTDKGSTQWVLCSEACAAAELMRLAVLVGAANVLKETAPVPDTIPAPKEEDG